MKPDSGDPKSVHGGQGGDDFTSVWKRHETKTTDERYAQCHCCQIPPASRIILFAPHHESADRQPDEDLAQVGDADLGQRTGKHNGQTHDGDRQHKEDDRNERGDANANQHGSERRSR